MTEAKYKLPEFLDGILTLRPNTVHGLSGRLTLTCNAIEGVETRQRKARNTKQ